MSNLEEVGQRVRQRVHDVESEMIRIKTQADMAESIRARSIEITAEADTVVKARVLLETYTSEESERLLRRIEGLVSRGLEIIFGPGYGFVIEMGQSRGQATAAFKIKLADELRDPLDSHGGGLVNVVSFVLRLVVAALTPGLSRTIVLDEPFAQLSSGYLEGVGEFIRELVDATGIQLILVSHEEEVAAVADRAYRLEKTRSGIKKEEM